MEIKLQKISVTSKVLSVLGGILFGLGIYTFNYAQGISYLTNNSNVCTNCHVMQNNYNAWIKSSHHSVATCDDCHIPQDSILEKLLVKSRNGFNHSLAFTQQNFYEPIQITPRNQMITEKACRYCHMNFIKAIDTFHNKENSLSCIRCHSEVGH